MGTRRRLGMNILSVRGTERQTKTERAQDRPVSLEIGNKGVSMWADAYTVVCLASSSLLAQHGMASVPIWYSTDELLPDGGRVRDLGPHSHSQSTMTTHDPRRRPVVLVPGVGGHWAWRRAWPASRSSEILSRLKSPLVSPDGCNLPHTSPGPTIP